jgi:hypothetical protein
MMTPLLALQEAIRRNKAGKDAYVRIRVSARRGAMTTVTSKSLRSPEGTLNVLLPHLEDVTGYARVQLQALHRGASKPYYSTFLDLAGVNKPEAADARTRDEAPRGPEPAPEPASEPEVYEPGGLASSPAPQADLHDVAQVLEAIGPLPEPWRVTAVCLTFTGASVTATMARPRVGECARAVELYYEPSDPFPWTCGTLIARPSERSRTARGALALFLHARRSEAQETLDAYDAMLEDANLFAS